MGTLVEGEKAIDMGTGMDVFSQQRWDLLGSWYSIRR